LYSNILQTGGEAFGDISTKSSSCSLAIERALFKLYIPTSIFSPTKRISCAVIFSLIL
tara:strand:- start:75 stop:248 length:174 start_codon:yes stop_codon:yes gene_type:complete